MKDTKLRKIKKDKQKITFKSYLKNFLEFVIQNLEKKTLILFVIAILLIAISIKTVVNITLSSECSGVCRDGITFFSEYISKVEVILIIALAGIVPYIYAPVVGFIASLLSEVSSFAYIIKGYGYLKGIMIGIVPLLLNVICACIVTALGIYMCRKITVGYRISSLNNMNFTNFRIKFYEAIGNEKKSKMYSEKKEEKLKKLEGKKEKVKWLQVLNTCIVVAVLQFISEVILIILI